MPVWQAVRPAGRALSVHQGKAANALGAKIGALCEAIESDCAEKAPADGPLCAFAALPAEVRAEEISDYAARRDRVASPGEPVRWCVAEEIASGRPFHLPHDLVSLDLARRGLHGFDRSSAGLALGATVEDARTVSLLELIERDAVGRWLERPRRKRLAAAVRPENIHYGWFASWRERLAALRIDLAVFRAEAVVPVSAIVCWIGGMQEYGGGYRAFSGSACRPDPEQALFGAMAEAIQSRLTFIAGVRDDILPSHYASDGASLRWSGEEVGAMDWGDPEPGPASLAGLVDALATAGFRRVAAKRLDRGLDGIAVTKLFVPGLGSLKRGRRAGR